jgi:hypothetical protein
VVSAVGGVVLEPYNNELQRTRPALRVGASPLNSVLARPTGDPA